MFFLYHKAFKVSDMNTLVDSLDLDLIIYLCSNIQIHKGIYYILETEVF